MQMSNIILSWKYLFKRTFLTQEHVKIFRQRMHANYCKLLGFEQCILGDDTPSGMHCVIALLMSIVYHLKPHGRDLPACSKRIHGAADLSM